MVGSCYVMLIGSCRCSSKEHFPPDLRFFREKSVIKATSIGYSAWFRRALKDCRWRHSWAFLATSRKGPCIILCDSILHHSTLLLRRRISSCRPFRKPTFNDLCVTLRSSERMMCSVALEKRLLRWRLRKQRPLGAVVASGLVNQRLHGKAPWERQTLFEDPSQ